MKRIVFIALMLVVAGAAMASAQTATPGAPGSTAPRVGQAFVDANGDGICDNIQNGTPRGQGAGMGRRGYGPGDGTGNQGVGPRDGSGHGPGGQSGNCDGTGPKGQGQRRGRR